MDILRKYIISQDLFKTEFPYEHVTFTDAAFLLIKPKKGDEFYHMVDYNTRFSFLMRESLIFPQLERLCIPGAPAIRKTTYKICEWTIDRYSRPQDLVIACILLEESEEVPLYGWLKPHIGQDVTSDVNFTDMSLALKGLPSYI
jgi:CYTH domain-containing protein